MSMRNEGKLGNIYYARGRLAAQYRHPWSWRLVHHTEQVRRAAPDRPGRAHSRPDIVADGLSARRSVSGSTYAQFVRGG